MQRRSLRNWMLLLLYCRTSGCQDDLRLEMLRRRLRVHLVVPLLLRSCRVVNYCLRGCRVRSRLRNRLLQRGSPHGWNRRSCAWTHFGHR
ncbi:hypothetical protein quinque_002295 [Culex quinquefasciatus]